MVDLETCTKSVAKQCIRHLTTKLETVIKMPRHVKKCFFLNPIKILSLQGTHSVKCMVCSECYAIAFYLEFLIVSEE